MGKYRDAMLMEMRLKGFSPKTVKAYLENVRAFVSYYGKSPVQLGEEEIRGYLHYLFAQRGSSYSTVNIAYSALRFFYTKTLRREWNVEKIPRPHDRRRLPTLLDTSEVKRIFEAVANLKHRTILMTIYSAGLRVSEAVHLKVGDIDSKRMQIRLDQAKGNKDRYTILSEVLLRVLRHYWRFYQPRYWLFPGRIPDQPISISAIQRVFRRAKQDAGIVKSVSVHTLRHSFATHMLDLGVDVFRIQKLLGHSSIKTTRVYIHLQNQGMKQLVNPLDGLVD